MVHQVPGERLHIPEAGLIVLSPSERFCHEQKNVLRKQRHWERQLAAKKSKRKDEKQRRRMNRQQEPGADRFELMQPSRERP